MAISSELIATLAKRDKATCNNKQEAEIYFSSNPDKAIKALWLLTKLGAGKFKYQIPWESNRNFTIKIPKEPKTILKRKLKRISVIKYETMISLSPVPERNVQRYLISLIGKVDKAILERERIFFKSSKILFAKMEKMIKKRNVCIDKFQNAYSNKVLNDNLQKLALSNNECSIRQLAFSSVHIQKYYMTYLSSIFDLLINPKEINLTLPSGNGTYPKKYQKDASILREKLKMKYEFYIKREESKQYGILDYVFFGTYITILKSHIKHLKSIEFNIDIDDLTQDNDIRKCMYIMLKYDISRKSLIPLINNVFRVDDIKPYMLLHSTEIIDDFFKHYLKKVKGIDVKDKLKDGEFLYSLLFQYRKRNHYKGYWPEKQPVWDPAKEYKPIPNYENIPTKYHYEFIYFKKKGVFT